MRVCATTGSLARTPGSPHSPALARGSLPARLTVITDAEGRVVISTARLYAVGERTAVRVKSGNVIFSFHSENEESDDSVESEGLLEAIISVRSELTPGDLRALYLGWLLCVRSGEFEPVELSPPVPSGLAKLSGR
jgi:hypothetical protein